MKRITAFALIVVFCVFTAFAGGTSETKEVAGEESPMKIGLCLTQLGDNSISDQLYGGVLEAQKKYGFELDYTECGTTDMGAVMKDYTESEEYDLIILLSYHAMSDAIAMTEKYPDQKYLIYDVACPGYDSIVSETFAKNQLGFVAGVFAALMDKEGEVTINGNTKTFTPSGKFGAMIGVELTSTVGAMTGFYAGVKYINPDAEIQYVSVGSWTDQAKAKELALTVYSNGANFIFHNAGGAFLGAVEAAKTTDKFAIGYDANQNNLDATHILASSHKLNSDVVMKFFDEFCTGNWQGGSDILNGYHNGGAAMTYQDGLELSEDVKAIMDETIAKIQSGEIVPPNTWEELESFDLHR